MTLYIATPINARKEKTLREKLIAARHRVNMLRELIVDDARFAGYDLIISTFGVNSTEEPYDEARATANCIHSVLMADAIYLDHGWQGSKGCNLEYRAAKIYGKAIFEHDKL